MSTSRSLFLKSINSSARSYLHFIWRPNTNRNTYVWCYSTMVSRRTNTTVIWPVCWPLRFFAYYPFSAATRRNSSRRSLCMIFTIMNINGDRSNGRISLLPTIIHRCWQDGGNLPCHRKKRDRRLISSYRGLYFFKGVPWFSRLIPLFMSSAIVFSFVNRLARDEIHNYNRKQDSDESSLNMCRWQPAASICLPMNV